MSALRESDSVGEAFGKPVSLQGVRIKEIKDGEVKRAEIDEMMAEYEAREERRRELERKQKAEQAAAAVRIAQQCRNRTRGGWRGVGDGRRRMTKLELIRSQGCNDSVLSVESS